MTRTTRKFFAIILLVLLLVVPFINWRLGAVFWMCAWLIFIMQKLFSQNNWKLGNDSNEEDKPG